MPALLAVIGALIAVLAVSSLLSARDTPPVTSAAPVSQPSALDESIQRAQTTLRRNPENAALWAQLGASYVEKARISGDPSYYGQAQGALDRSLAEQPDGNGEALIGLGLLANARHDFTAARVAGEQARELRPYTASADRGGDAAYRPGRGDGDRGTDL